jgi:hypothetical protein
MAMIMMLTLMFVVMVVAVCAAAVTTVGMFALTFVVDVFAVRLSTAITPIRSRSIIPCRTRGARCSSTASAAGMHPRGKGWAPNQHPRQLRGVGAVLDGAAHKLQQNVPPAVCGRCVARVPVRVIVMVVVIVTVAMIMMMAVVVVVAMMVAARWRIQLARHALPALAGGEENGERVDMVVYVHASGQAVNTCVIHSSEQRRVAGGLRQHLREPI